MFLKSLFFFGFFVRAFSFQVPEKGVGPGSYDPYLTFNDRNAAFIIWNNEGNVGGGIYYALYDPLRKNFDTCYLLTGAKGIHAQGSLSKNGKGVAVWDDLQGHVAYSIYDKDIKKFTDIKKIQDGGLYGFNPFLKINDEGNGLCIFSDATMILYYSFYNPVEQIFTPATSLANTKVSDSIHAGFNSVGESVIVWSDLSRNGIFYSFYNHIFKRFEAPKQLLDSADGCNAVVSLNNQGDCIVAWNTGAKTALVGSICYAVYDKIAKKFTPTEIIMNEQQGYYPQVALNDEGDSILSWSSLTPTGKNSLLYATFDKTSNRFSFSKSIEKAGLYSTGCQLSLSEQGEAILTWFTTLSGMIQYAIYDNAKQKFLPAQFVPEAGINSAYPQIRLNNNGEAILTWSVFGGIEYSIYDSVKKTFSKAKLIPPASSPKRF